MQPRDLKRKERDSNQSDKESEPAKRQQSARAPILEMRTVSNQVIMSPNGTQKARKTSMLVDGSMMPPSQRADFTNSLTSHFSAVIPSHRPIDEITLRSEMGSPLAARTPNGTTLKRSSRLGALSIFANDAPTPKKGKLDFDKMMQVDKAFFTSPEFAAIKQTQDTVKLQTITITEANLASTRAEYAKKKFKRASSQNQVMAETPSQHRQASATGYVLATELFSGKTRWEWLHLIAYAIGGPKTQNAKNLVAGTVHANTDMMFAEHEMEFLAKQYPQGFTLNISADLIKDLHIATKITYTIKTDDFTLALEFDPQNENKPHISTRNYIHTFLVAFIEAKKAGQTQTVTATSSSSTLFYDKTVAEDGTLINNNDSKLKR